MGCCAWEVCCPPDQNGKASPKAIAAVAEILAEGEGTTGSYEECAKHMLDAHRLIPRTIDAGPLGTADQKLEIAQRLLEHLGRIVSHELHVILELAGHPTREQE